MGKQLYLRVRDIFPQHDAPSVLATDGLKKTIIEMTSKRLGATAVLDEAQNLIGVITDGDLRRLLPAALWYIIIQYQFSYYMCLCIICFNFLISGPIMTDKRNIELYFMGGGVQHFFFFSLSLSLFIIPSFFICFKVLYREARARVFLPVARSCGVALRA